jgi:hypothetical protein
VRSRSATPTAALLLLFAACAAPDADDADPGPAHPALPERPGTVQDTLLIEGMPEPTTARLVRSPAGFGAPFTTYVPEGVDVDFEEGGDSAGVRFSAAFTGAADPNAYMHVRLYAPGATAAAQEVAASFLRSRLPQDHPVNGSLEAEQPYAQVEPPSWGDEAFAFRYAGERNTLYVGRIVLARQNGRVLHVLTHYPAEYGDGLGPRFARILQQWRWEDTGRMFESATNED